MKDSGIEWIGEIPDNWKINKIKYLFKNGKGLPITKEDLIEEGLPVISYGQIHSKTNTGVNITRDLIRFVNYDYKKKFPQCEVYKYDFIFADTSEDYEGCGNCVYKRDDSILFAGYHSIILHSINKKDNRYLAYLFKADFWRKQLREVAFGVKVFSITKKILLNSIALIPPLEEQKKIADFLDNKCSKIDRYVEILTNQIKNLVEYKKSLITETVTMGLNPDKSAPSMKEKKHWRDSGIDWIGEIPDNWKISRLKYLLDCPMKYGASETGVTYDKNLPRYIRITDITQDNKLKDEGKLSLTFEQAKGYILKSDTILFARSGATVGKTFLYLSKYGLCAFAGYLISAIPNKNLMLAKWLYYYSQSNSYWNWVNIIFTQATIQNIGADKYSNMEVPLPPVEEQKKIADFLDNKCSKVDRLLELKKKQIENVKEYKKSLIYEYVTGKKEVK